MVTADRTDGASLHSLSTCFQRASEKFATSLTDKKRQEFIECSLEDVRQTVNILQKEREDQKKMRNMARLQAFLEAMDQYRKVVEAFINCTPFLGYVWGPIRFILLVANTWVESLDIVLDAYQEIGERLPLFLQYERLFVGNSAMRGALELYFCDIVEFHYNAFKFVTRPGWKRLFRFSWKTFETQFRRILDSLARHKELIESEKGTVTLFEIQDLHELNKLQFKEIIGREQTRQVSVLLEKLNAPSYHLDQCAASEHRRGRSSGSWVLLDEKFQKWANISAEENPLLYIHGIPGSGKTTLASFMIERLQEEKSVPVVFFYCKHGERDKNNFNGILRALVAQLLYEDHALTSSLYNICSSKDQAGVTMILEELAGMAFDSKETSFVVLDGLDECLPGEAKKTLSWFQSQQEKSSNADSGHIRLLCVGQRVEVLQRELSSAADIKLDQNVSHLADVERYVKEQADALKADFELSSQDETEIVTRVVGGAKSMFLFAKLVMENLGNQTSQNDLRKELEPTTFPVDLGQAYGRVVSNVFKEGPQRTAATGIISWVACAKRPLKWREVQAIFCIDPKGNTCDFKGRKLRKSCKKLCGSLVDLQSAHWEPQTEAVLSLVHDTARDFLVRKALLNVSLQHAKMALFCTEYLLSSPFDYTFQADELSNHVRSGYYALQDYALSHWLDHMRYSLRAKNPPDISVDTHNDLASHLRSFVKEYGVPEKRQYLERIHEEGDLVDSIPKDISAWSQWFDLEWRADRVRGVIGSLVNGSTSDDIDRDTMRDIYGTRLFKCSRLACNLFTTGFDSKTEQEGHLNEHERPFHCVEQFCPYHTLGFRTEAELESHLTHNHHEDNGNNVSFPEPPTKRKKDSIFKACARGDITAAKSFLDNGEDINKASRPNGRETPLYVAAENGRLNVCKMLIDRGADINHQGILSNTESTALDTAISSGHLEIIQYFLEQSDILKNQREGFMTPLMVAAETGQERIVQMLLAIDVVDLNMKDRRGRTALSLAVEKDQEAVVKVLLVNGKVDPNAVDEYDRTPLSYAAQLGHETIVKLLLATDKIDPEIPDESGRTPAIWAAQEHHLVIVELLLAKLKVKSDVKDRKGRTTLLSALVYDNRWGYCAPQELPEKRRAIVKILLSTNLVDIDARDETGESPLMCLARSGSKESIQLLLDLGANPNLEDWQGQTALNIAAKNGRLEVFDLLLVASIVVEAPEILQNEGEKNTEH